MAESEGTSAKTPRTEHVDQANERSTGSDSSSTSDLVEEDDADKAMERLFAENIQQALTMDPLYW